MYNWGRSRHCAVQTLSPPLPLGENIPTAHEGTETKMHHHQNEIKSELLSLSTTLEAFQSRSTWGNPTLLCLPSESPTIPLSLAHFQPIQPRIMSMLTRCPILSLSNPFGVSKSKPTSVLGRRSTTRWDICLAKLQGDRQRIRPLFSQSSH